VIPFQEDDDDEMSEIGVTELVQGYIMWLRELLL